MKPTGPFPSRDSTDLCLSCVATVAIAHCRNELSRLPVVATVATLAAHRDCCRNRRPPPSDLPPSFFFATCSAACWAVTACQT